MTKEELSELTEQQVKDLDAVLASLAIDNKVKPQSRLRTKFKEIDTKDVIRQLHKDNYVNRPPSDMNTQITTKGKNFIKNGGYTQRWKALKKKEAEAKKQQEELLEYHREEHQSNLQRNKAIILSAGISFIMLILTIRNEYIKHHQLNRIQQLEVQLDSFNLLIRDHIQDTVLHLRDTSSKDLYSIPQYNKNNDNLLPQQGKNANSDEE